MDASLVDSYRRIYKWYREGAGVAQLKGLPELESREQSHALISNLPEPDKASNAEMLAVMHEVRSGRLEWGYAQRNGERTNGAIANEILAAPGGGLSEQRLYELSSESPLWVFLGMGSARALLDESVRLRNQGRLADADHVLENAVEQAQHDPVTRARIAIVRASIAKDRGDLVSAREIAEAGISLADSATPKVRETLREQLFALIGEHRDVGQPLSETRALFDLSQYRLSPGASNILLNAAKRSPPHQLVSTSFVFFESVELGRLAGDAYWIADFLRQSVAKYAKKYDEVRGSYLARMSVESSDAPVQSMTAGLEFTLRLARDLALRTTDDETINGRHLVAAFLLDPPDPHRLGAAKRLEEIGIDVPLLRERLYDWLRGYGDKDDVGRSILVGIGEPPRRLAQFNADHVRGPDLLNIEQDVVALATLIAARAVVPPLSIGLFGDWGSGKTFFMQQLRQTVAALSKEARDKPMPQRELPFYKRIVQIEFNAWHYVEGNLWASLVEHIFSNLNIPDDTSRSIVEEMQKHWIAKLGFSEIVQTEANKRESEAAARVKAAEREVRDAKKTHEDKKQELQGLSAKNVARDFQLAGVFDVVVKALEPLGLKPLNAAVSELQSGLRQARSVVERGNAAVTPLLHAEDKAARWRSLLTILIGAPVAAFAVGLLLMLLGDERIGQISALATGSATFLGFGARWLREQARWMSDRLTQVEIANKKYDEALAQEQALTAEAIARTEQELALARQDYAAAKQRVEQASREKEAVQTELLQTTSARLLARFIEDRASSSDYRKHLGVLALVRDDFERLSELIEAENWQLSPPNVRDERFDGRLEKFASLDEELKEARNRINRIVLYIDDLDRCPPAKVVDVLQAVHLLLAFPLFVVVVGVDARWVSRSLETRYRELLHVGPSDGDLQLDNMFGVVRSEDYLEKIFQIPLWLRPMDPANVRHMVQSLLGPYDRAHPTQEKDQHPNNDKIEASKEMMPDAGVKGPKQMTLESPSNRVDEPSGRIEKPGTPDPKERAIPNLESLDVRDFEHEVIDDLSPLLGRSPRALKRFINIYRLIKARFTPAEHKVFIRRREEMLSEFEAVLWLLAVDTGLPSISRKVFILLNQWVAAESAPAQSQAKNTKPATGNVESLIRMLDEQIEGQATEWATLKDWLLERKVNPRLVGSGPELVRWIATVSRYSFQSAQIEAVRSQ
jgi:hypothetical protein